MFDSVLISNTSPAGSRWLLGANENTWVIKKLAAMEIFWLRLPSPARRSRVAAQFGLTCVFKWAKMERKQKLLIASITAPVVRFNWVQSGNSSNAEAAESFFQETAGWGGEDVTAGRGSINWRSLRLEKVYLVLAVLFEVLRNWRKRRKGAKCTAVNHKQRVVFAAWDADGALWPADGHYHDGLPPAGDAVLNLMFPSWI